jgi:hypothetical protein
VRSCDRRLVPGAGDASPACLSELQAEPYRQRRSFREPAHGLVDSTAPRCRDAEMRRDQSRSWLALSGPVALFGTEQGRSGRARYPCLAGDSVLSPNAVDAALLVPERRPMLGVAWAVARVIAKRSQRVVWNCVRSLDFGRLRQRGGSAQGDDVLRGDRGGDCALAADDWSDSAESEAQLARSGDALVRARSAREGVGPGIDGRL